jgi:transposase
MLVKTDKRDGIFQHFRMRDLISDDRILKLIDKHVDFSFIREKVKQLHSEKGRPSVDPGLMVRMLLVGYLFGITHERRLCRACAVGARR